MTTPQPRERIGQLEKAALRRFVDNTDCAGFIQSFAKRRLEAFAIIDKQHCIVLEVSSQFNRVSLPSPRVAKRGIIERMRGRLSHFQLRGRIGDPLANLNRRS